MRQRLSFIAPAGGFAESLTIPSKKTDNPPRTEVMAAPKPVNGPEKTIRLQKLGINDSYQLAMYLLDQYRGTALSCRYIIPARLATPNAQTKLEDSVRAAVVDVIMKHPMLQVGLADANSKSPSWIQLHSLDLTQHIHWVQIDADVDYEQNVLEIFRAQLDEKFSDLSSVRQPGWKLTIMRQGHGAPTMKVLLLWNHPWFDGAGARVIHEDLLEMLNNINHSDNAPTERPGLEGNILTLPKTAPLLPVPIERQTSLPVDFKYLARTMWEESRPKFMNRDISQASWCPLKSGPYKTQSRNFYLGSAALRSVLALCRQHKTTITGLINALALMAFCSRLNATTAPAFQSSTCMDHRRNLPASPADAPWGRSDRTVGNYVTQNPHMYDADLVSRIRGKFPKLPVCGNGDGRDLLMLSEDLCAELWDVAATNRAEIAKKLEGGLRNDMVGVYKYVGDWKQTMREMADEKKKTRQFSWMVTNIGVLDGGNGNGVKQQQHRHSGGNNSGGGSSRHKRNSNDHHGGDDDDDDDEELPEKWTIERAQFGLSAEIPAAAIEFSPVSVGGRGMYVTASWPDCALDIALGEGIVGDMERWLGQLAIQ